MNKETKGTPLEEVIKAVVDLTGEDREDVTKESRLKEDLIMDSLDKVELVIELEKKYMFLIPDKEVDHIRTIGDLADVIDKLLERQKEK